MWGDGDAVDSEAQAAATREYIARRKADMLLARQQHTSACAVNSHEMQPLDGSSCNLTEQTGSAEEGDVGGAGLDVLTEIPAAAR